jgi:phospholipid-binding lipoprotein MlaA
MRFPAKILPLIAIVSTLSACTTANIGQDRLAERDPLQKANRGIFAVNMVADKFLVKPVTQVYRAVAPKPARQGIAHFFDNIEEPFSLINNLLQGHPDRALRNLGRFVVNSTIGIGGLFDPASRHGIKPAPEDLGQTFAAWGMNGGPFLMLPLLGPSTLRDGVGTGIAQFGDPYHACQTYCGLPHHVPLALTGAQLISARADLIENGADAFLESSLDPYAAMRSAYLQTRRAAILNLDGDDAAAQAAAEAAAAADAEANPIDAGTPAPPAPAAVPAVPGTGNAAPAQPTVSPEPQKPQ